MPGKVTRLEELTGILRVRAAPGGSYTWVEGIRIPAGIDLTLGTLEFELPPLGPYDGAPIHVYYVEREAEA